LMGCRRWLGDSIPLSAPTLTWLGWGPCSSVRNSALVTCCLCQSSNCQCLGLLMLFKSCPCCPTGAWNTCFVCSHVCCSLLSNLVEVAVDCVWIFFVECWPQSDASAIRFFVCNLLVLNPPLFQLLLEFPTFEFSMNFQPMNSLPLSWIEEFGLGYLGSRTFSIVDRQSPWSYRINCDCIPWHLSWNSFGQMSVSVGAIEF
jgi:hypothetical protein